MDNEKSITLSPPSLVLSAAYHDVHHDFKWIKKNYSQPFFTHWDWIMGEEGGREGDTGIGPKGCKSTLSCF